MQFNSNNIATIFSDQMSKKKLTRNERREKREDDEEKEIERLHGQIQTREEFLRLKNVRFQSAFPPDPHEWTHLGDPEYGLEESSEYVWDKRYMTTHLARIDAIYQKHVDENRSANTKSTITKLLDKHTPTQKAATNRALTLPDKSGEDRRNTHSPDKSDRGKTPEHDISEIDKVNKVVGNQSIVVQTDPCNMAGQLVSELQQKFDREIDTVNTILERAKHCSTQEASRKILLNTLITPNGQAQILNIIRSKAADTSNKFEFLFQVPTGTIVDNLRE